MDNRIFNILTISIIEHFENPRNFFHEIHEFLFFFCFKRIQREMFTIEKKMGARRPKSLVYLCIAFLFVGL